VLRRAEEVAVDSTAKRPTLAKILQSSDFFGMAGREEVYREGG
jgi:hypothetical protein